jgi:hypothetical protein
MTNMMMQMRQRQLAQQGSSPDQAYAPTAGGGVDPRMVNSGGGQPVHWNVPEANMPNLQLRQILSLRAQNGDRQAQAMLQRIA